MNNPAGADASLMLLLFVFVATAAVVVVLLKIRRCLVRSLCSLAPVFRLWLCIIDVWFVWFRIYFCSALTFASISMLDFAVSSCLSVVCKICVFWFWILFSSIITESHIRLRWHFSHGCSFIPLLLCPFLRFQICSFLLLHFQKKHRSFYIHLYKFFTFILGVCVYLWVSVNLF